MAQRGCGGRAAATAEAPAAQKAVALVAVRSVLLPQRTSQRPRPAHSAHSGTGTSISDSRSRAGCERAVQLVEEERDDGCRRVACRAASALARHRAHEDMWLRHGAERTRTAQWSVPTRHFSIVSARSMKSIAYNVNQNNPYLFTSGKCTLSSSLSR